MNLHVVAKYLGQLLATFALAMFPSFFWSLYYSDGTWLALLASVFVTLAAAAGLYYWGRRHEEEIFRKEATAIVGLGWIFSAFFGALPFAFARLPEMSAFADCYFESMSGLTTTGASVLTDIESVPRGILFWRSTTHWLGGLGIIMLFIAILPYLGAGGRALVKSEVTGPVKDGLTPRIKDTAILLYKVYIGYTILETILLMFAGMDLFDSLCHTFGTLATGGFSTRNNSMGAFYDTGAAEIVVLVFMILAGTNFALMHTALRGKPLQLLRDGEWRFYISTIFVCTFLITGYLLLTGTYETSDLALRDSLFTVVSLMTTTGYVTADFETWPAASKCILGVIMFVGGCAGSTGGGMKVMRWIILLKIGAATVEKVYRPRNIRQIKLGKSVIQDDLQQATLAFLLLWVLVFVSGAIAIAFLEGGRMDLLSAFSASASSLNNIGPGFNLIAATQNFGDFSSLTKWLISLLMVLGRLELYSIMVLFVPQFWRAR